MAGRLQLYAFWYYYVASNIMMLLVYSLSSTTIVDHFCSTTWRKSDDWIYGNGTLSTAKVCLSTHTSCSFSPHEQELQSANYYPLFAFGFFKTHVIESHFVLGIFMLREINSLDDAVVVWVANGDRPVGESASLHLTAERGLELKEEIGHSSVWSTDTYGYSYWVSSMNLTCNGNLILVDESGGIAWQSYDQPTDTLLQGQALGDYQILSSRASSDKFSKGLFYVQNNGSDEWVAMVKTSSSTAREYGSVPGKIYNSYYKLSLGQFSFSYMRLEPDGHLKLFTYNKTESFVQELQIINDCEYPTKCGSYGVCSNHNQCTCPNDFKPINQSNLNLGCTPINPLSCSDTYDLLTFIVFDNVLFYSFGPYLLDMNVDTCKRECLNNCSCKAAIFQFKENTLQGQCSLHTKVLTLNPQEPDTMGYNYTTFVKVRRSASLPTVKSSLSLVKKLKLLSIALSVFIVVCVGIFCYFKVKSGKTQLIDPSDLIIDTVTRFSFESLRLATKDFRNKLGRGGFGSVFEGALEDGTQVAIKRLDSVGQGRKEFLAEVNTIGTLHHFNLVKLIGFCEEGLHRLLVYEYMHNGSLDKWIFNTDSGHTLNWCQRQKIIVGISKGLEYLHENCCQNIIHFDIKPQNILLDRDFNVKIADFGLAKIVDRDEGPVLTVIRGTPGYIAPELFTGRAVSVKVDVYSFGVLVLEIVCGRRIYGSSENDCLINLVKGKADEDQLSDLVNEDTKGMEYNKEEAVKMMKVAIWCLQPHFIRPTMSMVVKVLQSHPSMDALTDLSYMTMVHGPPPGEVILAFSTRPSESLLSGPR